MLSFTTDISNLRYLPVVQKVYQRTLFVCMLSFLSTFRAFNIHTCILDHNRWVKRKDTKTMEIGSDVESWRKEVYERKKWMFLIQFHSTDYTSWPIFFNLCMNSVACNFFIRLQLLVWKMCPQRASYSKWCNLRKLTIGAVVEVCPLK